jgi:drug/metabolite transporter (DMT)-like permease
MTETLGLALVLAAASALALNWGFFVQHEQAGQAPALTLRRPLHSLWLLFSRPRWLAGFVVGLGGWGLYALALAFGPLSLVQATSAGGIGILALLVARLAHVRLRRREWIGVWMSMAGLALLGVSLFGQGGAAEPRGSHPAATGAVAWIAASGVLTALFAGPLRRVFAPGASLGTGAGLMYAAGDVSTKALMAGGSRLVFVPALLAAHGLGFVLLQTGFQRGGALSTAGVATLLTNAAPIAAGMVVFGEPMPSRAFEVVRVAAFVTVVAGAVLLTRGQPAPQDERERIAAPGQVQPA